MVIFSKHYHIVPNISICMGQKIMTSNGEKIVMIKKNVIKSFSIVLLIVFLCSNALVILAHPGSLDENGGHYNRTTGEYHYREGYHTESSSPKIEATSIIYYAIAVFFALYLFVFFVWPIILYIIDFIKDHLKGKKP